ncbi:MAG TPA: alpha-L-arabinofuranosidase C-terminal domain-containing protein [Opitutaceae bacterium]|nr:alpha-L-arabinofuranosidase C-terminal domain-containing protein [Opitutaceae bacterium]
MMSPRILSFAAASAWSLGATYLAAAAEPIGTLTVQVDLTAPAKSISPDLFGVFFEDLNYAADGGLYAELVQNRSFEYDATEQREWNSFTAWAAVGRGAGAGNVAVRSAKPLHANNPHYISIDAKTPGEGFGVANAGFDGIPLRAGETYEASFFAHQLFIGEPWTADNDIVGRPMPVVVQLESANGDILAEGNATISGRDWARYAVRLVPARTEPKARVVVLARAKGGIALDEISLFPERTFRDRRNGLRADLAQAIADLKPKFIRFPGGCLAHGDGVNNFYRWKDTIGPVEQRRGQRNLWGYHQSVGLGYFEFFQFCEDIGARPLPVVPAAVSCQNSNFSPGHGQQCLPLEDLSAYIQDLCDLIEWANGPATSRWGAVRAAAGHPEPFGLRYLGVGNEDAITPGFEERFRLIQQALRERHPEIVVIGTVGPFPDGEDFERGWAFARAERVPLVDEHYYRSPDWFWENLHRYDSYDRRGPKVYVGEYAAHETDRRNTLRSALAEAAGCIGFERNGDVVLLSSYAPLFARRGRTQWTPDLIYFTGSDVFPSINYQVQRLFGQNSGDTLLRATSEGLPTGRRVAFSAVRDSASGDVILKLVNAEDRAVTAAVELRGATAGALRLVATTLTGTSANVANDDAQAPTVLPLVEESRVGPRFERALPAHSLTVLRLR